MKTIYFNFDSFNLTADARTVLGANAAWLKANPSSMVEIEGHCDERGTTEYNLALGAKRARAAMDYLVTLGVSPARIKTTSYGEELTSCREATEACHLNNRRARFVEIRQRLRRIDSRSACDIIVAIRRRAENLSLVGKNPSLSA